MRNIIIPKNLKIARSESQLLSEVEALICRYQISKLLICCGQYGKENLLNNFSLSVPCETIIVNNDEVDLLLQHGSKPLYDWVLAVGGGKVLDYGKYLSFQIQANFISIPTLVSHDGLASPVAVLNGLSLAAQVPLAVIVPLYLAQKSSISHIHSGIGDLISNLSAIDDWILAASETDIEIDDFSVVLAKDAAYRIILNLENLILAKADPVRALYEDEFIEALIESLCLSGIAMSIAGSSRPCSGAEHLISHAIDHIYGHGHKATHGIQVLVATLFLDRLRSNHSRFDRLKKIVEYFEIPSSFEEIGIPNIDEVLSIAPSMRPGRFTILNQKKSV